MKQKYGGKIRLAEWKLVIWKTSKLILSNKYITRCGPYVKKVFREEERTINLSN